MRRVLALVAAVAAIVQLSAAGAQASPPALDGIESLKVVFAARPQVFVNDRDSAQMIFTVDLSGGYDRVTQVTRPDGYTYDWPTWAFGGTKIVYTAMEVAAPEKGENVYVMDPDGSDRVQLTFGTWRHVQPKVSPDGRGVLFTGRWHEYPLVALFYLDLATGEVRNLSSMASEDGSRESDPKWSADGSRIVFANTRGPGEVPEVPTQIWWMRPDGTDRVRLTQDRWWNTDPSVSPDGRSVAISGYRGEGRPNPPDADGEFSVKFYGWHLSVLDLDTGRERVLTQGKDCVQRMPLDPCSPTEGPAWVPQWSPDGSLIGYISVRSVVSHGIYVVDPRGNSARPLVERDQLAITWWDWTTARRPANAPAFRAPPRLDGTALLLGSRPEATAPLSLLTSTADRWIEAPIEIDGETVVPEIARWTPDKERIVFTARRPVDPSRRPPDASELLGVERNVHYTFNDYTFVEMPRSERDVAEEQVYIMNADGSGVRQLTTPWTEDRLEAIPDGDLRGNTDPDVSPDGRYLVFTNTSTTIPESYILRVDLETGSVLNLSAISSGAMAVADSKPRFSPDGRRIAFSSIVGTARELFVMDADGTNVRQVTEDGHHNFDAAWSPDGRQLVYSSYRGELFFADDEASPTRALELTNWYLAKVDVQTGRTVTLTNTEESPAFRPVWSPDGKRIAYISAGLTKKQIDVAMMNADGTDRHLIVTLRTKEEFVDWR